VKVLVCGGRYYARVPRFCEGEEYARLGARARHEKDILETVMAELWDGGKGMRHLVHGGALGADMAAGHWAERHGVFQEVYEADWDGYGRAAGPMRNRLMLDDSRPDLVVAFPGGRGTANMVSIARMKNYPVREIA
jgi:hypothetical protein